VVENVQVDCEKTYLLGGTDWMGAMKEMTVLFLNGVPMGTLVILEWVVAMNYLASGKPPIYVFEELLMLESGLFLVLLRRIHAT
jgi:hypothetical protein